MPPFALKIPLPDPVPNKSPMLDPSSLPALPWNNYFGSLNPAINQIIDALTSTAETLAGLAIFPVTAYGAVGDGMTDDAPAFRAALAAAVANGGGTVVMPPTADSYLLKTAVPITSTVSITFQGFGRVSVVKRGADLPNGSGLFDIQAGAKNVQFDNFVVDGDVLVPAKLLYTDFGSDPLSPLLTKNTSFWLHDGVSFISFTNMVITHTGGYSILANADMSDITDLYFYRLQLENNRPNLFGTDASDINYGSWTGGVLFEGNGVSSTAMVRRATFISCSARCCTGNCYWQHLRGFSSLHEQISFADMTGEDIGLDFILFGGVTGYALNGAVIRRVGYISLNDNEIGTPRWLNGKWATAVDHSGLALGGIMNGVVICSANGASFDCDGMAESLIVGCEARIPGPEDPEYATDQIASAGFEAIATYGIQIANTNNLENAAKGNAIEACRFKGFQAGAIRLYATRDTSVIGCRIDAPATSGPPILIGNIANTDYQKANRVSIRACDIAYDPAFAAAAIFEDGTISAFTADQVNYALGNNIINPVNGQSFEFQKAAGSSSISTKTGLVAGSNYKSGLLLA